MFRTLTRFSVRLVERYLPDPYIFVIILTLLAGFAAMGVEGKSPMEIVRIWGDGFWGLLPFTMQMVLVLVTCFALTVLVDMALAVSVGVMLASLLFMRRMAALTKITLDTDVAERLQMPPGIRLYEIAGPMFFGAANRAMETLDAVGTDAKVVILSMKGVDVMDATGLIALESTLDRLGRGGRMVILTGLAPEPAALLERAGIKRVPDRLAVAPDLDTAVSMAIVHTARAT